MCLQFLFFPIVAFYFFSLLGVCDLGQGLAEISFLHEAQGSICTAFIEPDGVHTFRHISDLYGFPPTETGSYKALFQTGICVPQAENFHPALCDTPFHTRQ